MDATSPDPVSPATSTGLFLRAHTHDSAKGAWTDEQRETQRAAHGFRARALASILSVLETLATRTYEALCTQAVHLSLVLPRLLPRSAAKALSSSKAREHLHAHIPRLNYLNYNAYTAAALHFATFVLLTPLVLAASGLLKLARGAALVMNLAAFAMWLAFTVTVVAPVLLVSAISAATVVAAAFVSNATYKIASNAYIYGDHKMHSRLNAMKEWLEQEPQNISAENTTQKPVPG